ACPRAATSALAAPTSRSPCAAPTTASRACPSRAARASSWAGPTPRCSRRWASTARSPGCGCATATSATRSASSSTWAAAAPSGRCTPPRSRGVGVYGTESGLRRGDRGLGYALRSEPHMGGRRAVRLGLALRSDVPPIEDHGLSDRESSLAVFVLHRDFRDY